MSTAFHPGRPKSLAWRKTLLPCLVLSAASLLAAATPALPTKPAEWGDVFDGVIQDETQIKGFAGDYKWLSDFFPCSVDFEGLHYGSAEAAYQASKFPASERPIFTGLSADAAKKLAHSRLVDEKAWDARKEAVMRKILWAKFTQNPDLGEKLRATGKRYLEETNWWDDEYWGVFHGKGSNVLGKLLMETRDRLESKN